MKFFKHNPDKPARERQPRQPITAEQWRMFIHISGLLVIGALLAMCIQFFPSSSIAYVLCPWIYLPCFLYVSRRLHRISDTVVWLLIWVGSFMVRYKGILGPYNTAASAALTCIGGFVYAIPYILDRFTYHRGSRIVSLLMFPVVTAAIDYILELLTLGSLFSLAQTQFDNKPLLQLASVLGSKGITFVLTLWATMLICSRKNRKRILVSVLVIALLHGFGYARICVHSQAIEDSPTLTFGWSGEPVTDDSFFSDDSDGAFRSNIEYLTRALEEAQAQGVKLLAFPEESFFIKADNYYAFIEAAQDYAADYQINLLLPIESLNLYDEDALSKNEVLFINSKGELCAKYLKSKLIPIAEAPYYEKGNSILPDISIWVDGKCINLSYAICFDGDFSSYVRTMPLDTDLYFDVSWDWDAVDDLHYRIIGLRAVENGLTVTKPTVCGYTTVTDYLGNVLSITHSDITGYAGVNKLELPLATCDTIYHRFGNYIDALYFIGFALLLILLLVNWRAKMETTTIETKKKPLTRFGEFEFLKALAIIGLPMVHVMEEAMEGGMASSTLEAFGTGIVGLCAFGPSVFMICMGFGIGGGRTSYDSVRRTGIQFLLIGAILNVLRWLLPGIVQMIVCHTPLIEDVKFCLQSDIYYFAGIFFVFYSFMKQFKVTTPQLLLISIITLTVNDALTPLMQRYIPENSVVSNLLGNIIYVDGGSCFPLLSWMIFPTIGIIFGEVLKKRDDDFREVFMRRMMDFSIIFFGAFTFFLWKNDFNILKTLVSPANDYITDLPNVIMLIALACFLIGITYYLCKAIGHTKFMAFMLKISAFIIPFYLLQWIIIAWIFYATTIFHATPGSFGLIAYWLSVIAITALCIYVSSAHGMKIMKVLVKYTYIKKKRKKKAVKKDEK